MYNCSGVILSGVAKDCEAINASIGVDKDLILVNYDDFDKSATLATIEADNTNGNEGGLTNIELKEGAIQYIFEGTDYSVVPNVTTEVKENGDSWFIHAIGFTVYSKSSLTRTTLEDLAESRVIAIAVDRSTGLYELFGADQGLKLSGLERAYVGSQNSNFYSTTIATPDIAVVRESSMGYLAVGINTAV
ncbi:hypothetical protein DHD05_18875 [Arenibacter sp. N53]|uniref:hypothetical protein n=1 Tax=Arenibacter TaxID=178469 RepID=UPI000CD44647|nr:MULTISPECIES: hypothetical protein [Arenibacter]MCM4153661.1 hypothetical protein [Arenibacter sp. N53]